MAREWCHSQWAGLLPPISTIKTMPSQIRPQDDPSKQMLLYATCSLEMHRCALTFSAWITLQHLLKERPWLYSQSQFWLSHFFFKSMEKAERKTHSYNAVIRSNNDCAYSMCDGRPSGRVHSRLTLKLKLTSVLDKETALQPGRALGI